MLLALAIIATVVFLEIVFFIILSFIYDGLEGVEIWMAVNSIILIVAGVLVAVGGIVLLWVAALT